MKFIRITLLFVITAAISATMGLAQDKPAAQAAAKQDKPSVTKPTNSYKLDYMISEMENGKRVNSRSYSLLLTDSPSESSGKLHAGSRVPIATGSARTEKGVSSTNYQYIDVGVDIRARLGLRDDRLYLASDISTSGAASELSPSPDIPAPVIRQTNVNGVVTAVTLGKSMLLTSLDDAVSKRRYQVEVTVTKQ